MDRIVRLAVRAGTAGRPNPNDRRHHSRRSASGCCDRLPLLPPHAARAHHALDQRGGADDPVDERAADLQCPSRAVLGQVVVQRQAAACSRSARRAKPSGEPIGRYPRVRPRIRHDRRARASSTGRASAPHARGVPVVDDAFPGRSGCRWRARGISSSPGCSCSTASRYVAVRDREPASCARPGADARRLRGIGASIGDHLRFRHPTGEAAKRYNVLQKLAYLVVIFVLLPLIVLMGLGDVAAAGHAVRAAGSTSSAAGSRRAPCISSSRGCWSRSC